jgi:hypothetical protein
MAKTRPFFLTGANAKIKLNGRTIAFATDISYRVIVKHASPRVLGRFEVEAHQPLTYDVEGSFTIIRYAKDLSDKIISPGAASPKGSGAGAWGLHSGVEGAIGGALGLPHPNGQFDGNADEALIPSRLFQSKAFDIEIIQKLNNGAPPSQDEQNVRKVFGALSTLSAGAISAPLDGECMIAKLEGCRIEQADFTLSKRSAAIQTFTFRAQYAHEDTFIARKSGVGQELS